MCFHLNVVMVSSHIVTLPPPIFFLSPLPRWPDVPKRKSKNSQCSVKSMSGKDFSSPPSPLHFVVTSKQASEHSSEQVSSKTLSLLMCCLIWSARPVSPQQAPLGFEWCPRRLLWWPPPHHFVFILFSFRGFVEHKLVHLGDQSLSLRDLFE